MRRAIGIALHRDRRHGDDGELGKPPLYGVIFRLPLGQAEPRLGVAYNVKQTNTVGCTVSAARERRRSAP